MWRRMLSKLKSPGEADRDWDLSDGDGPEGVLGTELALVRAMESSPGFEA